MRIVMFSSVFNHHSMPLCDALNKLPDAECIFVETMLEEQERRDLGYHPYERNYVLNMLESLENRRKAHTLAMTADVMIASVFPYEFLKERLQAGKLTFLCQERMFKGGASLQRKLRSWLYNMRKFYCFRNKPLYFLSIGEKAAQDYHSIGFYKGKCFRWAYYPPFVSYDIGELMNKKRSDTVKILFVGRMIPLKHPEYALTATKTLLEKGYFVELTYIGSGPLEHDLRQSAEKIKPFVHFLGAMPPEKVREYMEEADMLVFSSNSLEGWGAVVNEAMNAGCAVVTSDAPGSAQTLVQDGKNGLIFENENYQQFYQKLELLVDDKDRTYALGEEAYKTIAECYRAEVAAERFYRQCDALLKGKALCDYTEGPMSRIL